MFKVEFPYDIGTFVKGKFSNGEMLYGTVSCYQCVDASDFMIMVSAYKEPFCAEFLIEDLVLLTEDEIFELKTKYN